MLLLASRQVLKISMDLGHKELQMLQRQSHIIEQLGQQTPNSDSERSEESLRCD